MKGTVKWFNTKKGYGFIIAPDEKEYFVHHSNIVMDGFRHLDKDDIVNFDLGDGKNGREQAINVQPFLTMKMVKESLKEENLYVKTIKDAHNVTKYLVVDANNILQTSEQGLDFLNLAAYAGFDIAGLTE